MSIDLTQQALNALADAGLGNDTPAEAYVIGYTQGHNDALALAIRIEQAITATPLTPDELDLLALALWEANGERPTVYESGKAVADDVLEWWKQVDASAWGFINGMEAMQGEGTVDHTPSESCPSSWLVPRRWPSGTGSANRPRSASSPRIPSRRRCGGPAT